MANDPSIHNPTAGGGKRASRSRRADVLPREKLSAARHTKGKGDLYWHRRSRVCASATALPNVGFAPKSTIRTSPTR